MLKQFWTRLIRHRGLTSFATLFGITSGDAKSEIIRDFSAWAAKNTKPAVALEMSLDEPSNSFFGGVPFLPSNHSWPRDEQNRPIPFLGQIDLGDLPRLEELKVPRSGMLFFFFDPMMNETGTAAARVLYAKSAGILETAIPNGLPALGRRDGDRYWGGGLMWNYLHKFESDEPPRVTLPKFTVRTRIVDSLAPYDWKNPLHQNTPGFLEFYTERADAYQTPTADKPTSHELGIPTFRDPGAGPDADTTSDWPWVWPLVEEIIHKRARLQQRLNFSQPDFDGYREWLDRAAAADRSKPISAEDRSEFVKWIYGKIDQAFLAANPLRKDSLPDNNRTTILEMYDRSTVSVLADLTLAGLPSVLDVRTGCAGMLPDDLLKSVERYLAHGFEVSGGSRHQMFGYGTSVQNAPVEYASHILLLQMDSHDMLRAHWGSGGVLQFWIDPRSLAKAQFEKAIVTLESH